jgi:hypothetical protein
MGNKSLNKSVSLQYIYILQSCTALDYKYDNWINLSSTLSEMLAAPKPHFLQPALQMSNEQNIDPCQEPSTHIITKLICLWHLTMENSSTSEVKAVCSFKTLRVSNLLLSLIHCGPVTQICVFCVTAVKDGWRKIAF